MKLTRIALVFAVLLAGCNSAKSPETAPSTTNSPATTNAPTKPTEMKTADNADNKAGTTVAPESNAAKLANFHLISADLDALPYKTNKVALTFDAGADDKATTLILQTLKERNAHCTFFLTGFFCRHFPEAARAIADAGHEIASHSDTHPHFSKCPDAKIQKELTTSEATIEKICGVNPKPLFRFPYGDRDKRSIATVYEAGYQSVRWTLDSLDAFGEAKSEEFVGQRITSKVKGGDIVLMHVSSIGSAKALPRIFAHLEKKGLTPVLVSELLNAIPETPSRKLAKQ